MTALVFVVAVGSCHCEAPLHELVGDLAGVVCRASDGQADAGAHIVVVDSDGKKHAAVADARGNVEVKSLPVGVAKLEVDGRAIDVDVELDKTVHFDDGACHAAAPPPPPPPPPGVGNIQGRVCGPDGQTWLVGATASVGSISATTDGDGRYTLTGVPAGTDTVDITKGSFSTTKTVTVTAGQTTVIPDDQCAVAPPAKFAVVTASDKVEQVLAEVGVDASHIDTFDGHHSASVNWAHTLLDDESTIAQYSALFVNCGADTSLFGQNPDQTIINNLATYVNNGGNLYVSDQAYEVIAATFPSAIDFYGNGSNNAANAGAVVSTETGNVVDAQLSSTMGNVISIQLHYPLSHWGVVKSANGARVLITANAPLTSGSTLTSVPHTVEVQQGQGHIVFTSFHQSPDINPQMTAVLHFLIFEL